MKVAVPLSISVWVGVVRSRVAWSWGVSAKQTYTDPYAAAMGTAVHRLCCHSMKAINVWVFFLFTTSCHYL